MKIFAVASVVALSLLSLVSCECNLPFEAVDEYCFYLSASSVTWFQAKVNCIRDEGGQLAVIDTEAKSQSLTSFLATNGGGDFSNYWIGATSVGLSEYVWDATGQEVSYGNWEGGSTPTTYNLVVYVAGADYLWYTGYYQDEFQYICEPTSC